MLSLCLNFSYAPLLVRVSETPSSIAQDYLEILSGR
jgi:hypothetical protein